MKVLVIDNDPDIAELICVGLGAKGYECLSAPGGREGLRQYHRALVTPSEGAPFDAVIVDIAMPDLDGYTVMQNIREVEDHSPVTPRAIIVAITGFPENERNTTILEKTGVDAYLTKPFTLDQLLSAIQPKGQPKSA